MIVLSFCCYCWKRAFLHRRGEGKRALTTYHISLNMTAVMLVVRYSLPQVLKAGAFRRDDRGDLRRHDIGHILLGVKSMVVLLHQVSAAGSKAR